VFTQDRVQLHLRVLVDASRDWIQISTEVRGVDERHLLASVVHPPQSLHELASVLPRQLLELVDLIRVTTGTKPQR
jgi:hypothetical protein